MQCEITEITSIEDQDNTQKNQMRDGQMIESRMCDTQGLLCVCSITM